MEDNNILQRESIKLMKMSKGYNWEIKVLPSTIKGSIQNINLTLGDKEIERLEQIDKQLREKYGEKEKE